MQATSMRFSIWREFLAIRYDNMKQAVAKILKGRNRHEQSSWVAFRSHFLFEVDYCTPGKGQEKGGSESGGICIRRNFLVPVPVIEDFHALNAYLIDCL